MYTLFTYYKVTKRYRSRDIPMMPGLLLLICLNCEGWLVTKSYDWCLQLTSQNYPESFVFRLAFRKWGQQSYLFNKFWGYPEKISLAIRTCLEWNFRHDTPRATILYFPITLFTSQRESCVYHSGCLHLKDSTGLWWSSESNTYIQS